MALLNTPGTSILQSGMLSETNELVHGFSTKLLGNMGRENKHSTQKIADITGFPQERIIRFHQIHGNRIVSINNTSTRIIEQCDGAVTASVGILLVITTADCAPVLFLDPCTKLVGIAHAGWRGTYKGIIATMITKMIEMGSKTEDICLVIGPHIAGCCYIVSAKRAKLFTSMCKDPLTVNKLDGKIHLDLGRAICEQAMKAGIQSSHIENTLTCTNCREDQFFSYRREQGKLSGKMIAYIGWKKE